jgi:vacuolar-type H+-ATPase subunit I/STV1
LTELAVAQRKQIKLSALAALLNSHLMRIGMLESEKISLLEGTTPVAKKYLNYQDFRTQGRKEAIKETKYFRQYGASGISMARIEERLNEVEQELRALTIEKNNLQEQIKKETG